MQSKQDQKIESGIGEFIILLSKFLIWSGILFARFIKFLASSFLLGLNILLGLARKFKVSKSKLARVLYLASLILSSFLLGISITYICLLSSGKDVSNNMLSASFFIFVILLGLISNTKLKISKKLLARNITKDNKEIKQRFESINFKDSLARFPLRVAKFEQGNYFEEHVFHSEISLASWQKNKSQIEEILNQRIISIKTDKKDTTMKIVKTSKLPEPTYVKWENKYFSKNPYEIFIGLDIYGQPTYLNLQKNPHTIISGGTNTGKSTNAFSFFTQLKQHACNRIILCDFKRVTFKSLIKFNNGKPPIINKKGFMDMMEWCKKENNRRIELFNKFDDCENLLEYNQLVENSDKLKNIFIFIDELAMIMDKPDKELEELIKHIAQTGRSQGFYLLVFTQRPSAKTVPAEARANFMSRLSSYQPDKNTSEMAIGDYSASELPDIVGRCILKLGGNKTEVQAVHYKKEYLHKHLKVNEL